MNIPINEFELHFNEAALEVGLKLFSKGKVNPLLSNNDKIRYYEVLDRTYYQVELEIRQDVVVHATCFCKTSHHTPFCAHVAACLLYISQPKTMNEHGPYSDDENPKSNKKKAPSKSKPTLEKSIVPSKNSIAGKIWVELEHATLNDLKLFICNYAAKDKTFRSALILQSQGSNAVISPEVMRREVKAIIGMGGKANSRNSWRASTIISKPLSNLLKTVNKDIANGNFEKAYYVSLAIVLELTPVFDYADDSSGRLQSIWADALNHAVACISQTNQAIRQDFIHQMLQNFHHGLAFDFGEDMYLAAIPFIETMDEYEMANKRLEYVREIVQDDWTIHRSYLWQHLLIKHFHGKEKADAFLLENKHITSLRNLLLNRYDQDGQWIELLQLAKEKIAIKSESAWMLGNTDQFLLRAYLHLGDWDEYYSLALRMTEKNGCTMSEWQGLSKIHTPIWEKWKPQFLQNILTNPRIYFQEKMQIFDSENMHQELMQLIESSPQMQHIQKYKEIVIKYKPALYIKVYLDLLAPITLSRFYTQERDFQNFVMNFVAVEKFLKHEKIFEIFQKMELLHMNKKAYQNIARPVLQLAISKSKN
jgi:hypothetical protein